MGKIQTALVYGVLFTVSLGFVLDSFVDYLDTPVKQVDLNGKCIRIITPNGKLPCETIKKGTRYEVVYVAE